MRCLPDAIPDIIEYDVSELEIDDFVRVKDIAVGANVEILLSPERKLISVAPPRVIEEVEVEGEEGEEGEAVEGEGEEGEAGEETSEEGSDEERSSEE